MSWLEKLMPTRIRTTGVNKGTVPEGVWVKCDSCGTVLYRAEVDRNQSVCPHCGEHMRISARARLSAFFDPDTQKELDANLEPTDPLKFRDSKKYRDRVSQANKSSGENEALIAMTGDVHGVHLAAIAFEFSYMGGSMGSVVGEKFVRAAEYALEKHVPLICFSASGGARMQEGILSLFQMAKTSSVLAQMSRRGLPYISVLTDPTMGGVSASFAMLGDVIIAEPKALIGFAGPRVIEQTVREKLPEGFQRAEFLLEHGAIDMIVKREDMRSTIASLLRKLMHEDAIVMTPTSKFDNEVASADENFDDAVVNDAVSGKQVGELSNSTEEADVQDDQSLGDQESNTSAPRDSS